MNIEKFSPSIRTPFGETVVPTNFEWVLAFALKGCQWAIDAIPEMERELNQIEYNKNVGGGI